MAKVTTIFIAYCLLIGCNQSKVQLSLTVVPTEGGKHPWTNLNFNNDPDRFQFAVVGDRTGQHRPGIFEKGIEKLNLLQPEFVMSVGDLIEGYTKDEDEIDEQWDEIAGFTGKLQTPFFYTPGNHDLANRVQAGKWRERFGPSYYHFVYRNVLFLVVNTYDPEQRVSPEQIASIKQALADNPGVRWTCVFMHDPLWEYTKDTGWDKVEALLADRPYTVFAGHYHTYTKYVRHDRRYIVLATTGGGWKKGLAGAELGSFDHVTWVTMTPQGPLLANIELDAIHDEDVRTEAMAKLINGVMDGKTLQISPVLSKQELFEKSEVKLTFTNDADVPMNAKGEVPAAGQLRATPDKFDLNIAPKSTGTVDLKLSAEKPTKVEEITPAAVKWTATFQPPGRNPVRVPRVDPLVVDRVQSCASRTAPVVIDGKLDEWPQLPLSYKPTEATKLDGHGGEKDSSYQFAVEHDDKFVYIAIKATDDRAILNPLKEPWSQDGVEVRFDARHDPERSQGRGHGEFKDILVISMSPGETRDKMVHYGADQLPPGVKAVCVKTDTGHNTEIAIPVSYLNDKQGGDWTSFRMNVVVDDFDAVAGPLKALWWRPDWRTGDSYSGSGTFERK